MAYEIPKFMVGVLPANQDLSDESKFQFTAVKVVAATGAGIADAAAADLPSASGDPIIGVLQNNPKLAEAATIMEDGISKLKAGATINVGDRLQIVPDGNGAGVAIPATSGKYQVAVALEAAVAGDIFTALLQRNGKA